MAEIEPVRSVEPDYTRCRALLLNVPSPGRQCSRRPVETRQDRDGKRYGVCRAHKRAKSFVPWTPWSLMDELEALSRWNRLAEELVQGIVDPPKRNNPLPPDVVPEVLPFKRP